MRLEFKKQEASVPEIIQALEEIIRKLKTEL
jgi:hypothetical protein